MIQTKNEFSDGVDICSRVAHGKLKRWWTWWCRFLLESVSGGGHEPPWPIGIAAKERPIIDNESKLVMSLTIGKAQGFWWVHQHTFEIGPISYRVQSSLWSLLSAPWRGIDDFGRIVLVVAARNWVEFTPLKLPFWCTWLSSLYRQKENEHFRAQNLTGTIGWS